MAPPPLIRSVQKSERPTRPEESQRAGGGRDELIPRAELVNRTPLRSLTADSPPFALHRPRPVIASQPDGMRSTIVDCEICARSGVFPDTQRPANE